MTIARLIIRGLRFYWRTNLAIVLGIALAGAVITGSLLVGDSVTGSLRDTALSRLGKIDHALAAQAFFRAKLATEVRQATDAHIVPIVITRGAAWNAETEETVPAVRVIGVDEDFWPFFPITSTPKLSGRQVALNQALARDLGVREGDALLLHVERYGAMPSGTLFAQRKRERTLRAIRLKVVTVLPGGMGDFSLDPAPAIPRNLFVSREWLNAQLGTADVANALLIASAKPSIPLAQNWERGLGVRAEPEAVQSSLDNAVSLADYGLKLVPNPRQGYLALESDALLLTEAQVRAAEAAATTCGATPAHTSLYLASDIHNGGKTSAYALIAAMEPLAPFRFLAGGGKPLGRQDIWLNAWMAEDLGAKVGDTLRVSYFVPAPDGEYPTRSLGLTVRGIVALDGPAADPALTPEIAGITDADSINEWMPPFPLDLNRITARDDEYWARYRTTPKAFINTETMRALWSGSGSDWITSIRLQPGPGDDLPALERRFAAELRQRLIPAENGLVARPVRQMALASAKGTTDFSQLFLGMSFFLVLAAAGLAGMLMRLAADSRAAQAGIMQACGFSARKTRRVILGEGLALSVVGTLLGVPLGILYGWAIIYALTTWWAGAVGATVLWLHVSPSSLLTGGVTGIIIGACSILWGTRHLGRVRLLDLLAGWRALATQPDDCPSRRAAVIAVLLCLFALVLIALATVGKTIPAPGAFFGSGALLLTAGLYGGSWGLANIRQRHKRGLSLPLLAIRNAAINRGRSLLVVGLLAGAAFLLVTVAANRRETRATAGAGGFSLRAVSSLPVHYDFGTPAGRKHLGFPEKDEALFRDTRVIPFLVSPGEDISCLNIAKPASPRILGVDMVQMDRHSRFTVQCAPIVASSWFQLMEREADGTIPVFGDADSVEWTLHSGLGKTITVPGPTGKPLRLRFVGLLKGSVFGGELLMAKENFAQIFPGIDTPRYFLIATPDAQTDAVASSLRRNLGDLGVEVRATTEVLNSLLAVQNTYLSTFLALGGLGLLLGTLGLVIVLLRNATERRGEFALMLATGFTREHLVLLLIRENIGLLIAGLSLGTLTALIATAPHLLSTEAAVNWISLVGTLAGILATGLISCAIAAYTAVRSDIIVALREE